MAAKKEALAFLPSFGKLKLICGSVVGGGATRAPGGMIVASSVSPSESGRSRDAIVSAKDSAIRAIVVGPSRRSPCSVHRH